MSKSKKEFHLYQFTKLSAEEQLKKSRRFFEELDQRRSLRDFSDKPIPEGIIENIVKAASTAPSGAHKQPWTFAVVQSVEMKKKIRDAAEKEEYENYHGRMGDEWLEDLKKFDTDWEKPFLEIAPALIVVFKQTYELLPNGNTAKNYYVNESVGIATGLLIAAIHQAGLVSLTHTPSPLNFLATLLNRPKNEKPYLLIPIGYPAEGAQVPTLERKKLDQVLKTY